MRDRAQRGFTLAELITVIAIVAILTAIAIPVSRFAYRREKETELRQRMAKLIWAIDRYGELRSKNLIKLPPEINQGLFPKKLEDLTKPIELVDGKKVKLLNERDLIDPMTGQSDWRFTSSTDDPDDPGTNSDNVWDVHSSSRALAVDGKTHYNEW
jgi:general secretion pathway protein G